MKARSLAELAALKQALRVAREQAAHALAVEQAEAARALRERTLFATSVGEVLPLRRGVARAPASEPPLPVARQRERDDAQVMLEALSDEFDVESLLDTDDSLSFRRRGIGPEVVRKLRRGVWAMQAQLDLHGLRRDQAREALGAFLHDARIEGWRCVRVIHGKGNGSPGREPVLKAKVKSWLVQKKKVLAFTQARAADGGAGAVMVLLQTA